MTDVDFNEMIPDLKEWDDGKGVDWYVWLGSIADFKHAIAYSQVFWPSFIEYKNCIFLKHNFTVASYNKWVKLLKNDLTAVEKLINHEHILDVFNNPNLPVSEKQLEFMGELLVEMWSCKLKKDFSDRRFLFQFKRGDSNNLMGYEITFWQDGVKGEY